MVNIIKKCRMFYSYEYNFQLKPFTKAIETLNVEWIDRLNANTWIMSPPCQPYTQGGKRLDDQDLRARGLLHLISILKSTSCPPEYIFVENVPNFEVSKSRELLVNSLEDIGYDIKEFLVSPIQFGIPNHRRRYYLTAVRFNTEKIQDSYLQNAKIYDSPDYPINSDPPSLDSYLSQESDWTPYWVPESFILKRKQFLFDISRPFDKTSSVITKAYGTHHVFGSGSLLQTKNYELTDFKDTQSLLQMGLRFFTPLEVAKLHGFPIDKPIEQGGFEFPKDLTIKQKWKLLGNSLNVIVVSELMSHYLFNIV